MPKRTKAVWAPDVPGVPGYEHRVEMRQQLKAARDKKGWSDERVAQELVRAGAVNTLTGEAVRKWEKFESHPSIQAFAAWARVLDHRLYVDVVEGTAEHAKIPIPRDRVALARLIQTVPSEDLELVGRLLRALPRLRETWDEGERFRRLVGEDLESVERELIRLDETGQGAQ